MGQLLDADIQWCFGERVFNIGNIPTVFQNAGKSLRITFEVIHMRHSWQRQFMDSLSRTSNNSFLSDIKSYQFLINFF